MGTGVILPEVKQQGRKPDDSTPSSAEVRNKWSYTPTPPTRFHGAQKDKFIFYDIHTWF
jgi:hypothetical protein